jgi:hypothetical protein
MRVSLLVVAGLAAAAVIGGSGPAHAQRFRVGRLLCLSTPRIGLVVGSTQSLRCEFYARRPPRQYLYVGRIRRIGLDLGATSVSTLSWAVFARNSRIGPSTLRGSYVGVSGNVTLGPGLGVNALIGGSRRAIVLQPLSVERSIGLNVAAGVTNLTLDSRGSR